VPESLEEALTRTLQQAATVAPEPAPDLAALLTQEHRRRAASHDHHRGWLITAAAAAVVAVVAGGAVVVDRFHGDRGVAPAHPPRPVASAPAPARTDYRDDASVDEVWPGALRRVPATLPNGKVYLLHGILPGGRLLVSLEDAQGSADALWSWDPDNRDLRPVEGSQLNPGKGAFIDVGFNDRWIVWFTQASVPATNQRADPVALWASPVAGGRPRRIAIVNDYEAGPITVVGDLLVVGKILDEAGTSTRGPWTVPVTGGTPRNIAGSEGYGVLDWPWLGAPPSHTQAKAAYERIWNVKTGDRRTAHRLEGMTDASCSLTWCVGRGKGGMIAQRRDGSGRWRVAGAQIADPQIKMDRFIDISPSTGRLTVLYDLRARKSVTMPPPGGTDGGILSSYLQNAAPNNFMLWRGDERNSATSYYLLDLRKMR
jgi:hypothetical protein